MIQLDGLKERLLWKKKTERLGDGTPYRTAFIERRNPTLLSKVIADSRTKMAVIGIITAFGAAKVGDKMAESGAGQVNYPVPELTTHQEGELLSPYMMIGPVKMKASAATCQSPASECFIDLGNGPRKYEPNRDPSEILRTSLKK